MPPPTIISSFLSVTPLEPVLVFHSSDDALYFQTHYCNSGRIYAGQHTRLYLPMPEGLLRVRIAKYGDAAYDFDTNRHAKVFNDNIVGLGRVYQNTKDRPDMDRSVYVGKPLLK